MTFLPTFVRRAGVLTALAVAATACSASPDTDSADAAATPGGAQAADAILASHGLAGLDVREVVDTLDATELDDRATDLMASVRPDELLLTSADGDEASLPMPDDVFYVSFAPYVDSTHDCYFHSLTTCTGEMGDTAVRVTVVDVATGDEVVANDMTTGANGFVGLWLPRDGEFEVTLDSEGLSATQTVTTDDDDDATCITTMQLT